MAIINLKNYLTASGKYPDREKHAELTTQLIGNAEELLRRVNKLLTELGVTSASVSSGFRPQSVNAGIANAAKKSYHTLCKAVDIVDNHGSLAQTILAKPDLLRKYDLWLEEPANTPGWCHLDNGTRAERQVRVFKP